ncbi:MAG: hypothetical protein GTO02_13525 [Candidatus Dadabacteria bacterium]|nr:hypothetical protein [Candidatus Dadabacteria bacterium]
MVVTNKRGIVSPYTLILLILVITAASLYFIKGNVHEDEAHECAAFFGETNNNYIPYSFWKNQNGQCCKYRLNEEQEIAPKCQ